MAGLPYVGSGVFASAASMDKEFTKKLLAAAGLPQGDHVVLRDADGAARRSDALDEAARERLGLPVFVKPARAGSSIGITKVTDWAQFPAAVAAAARRPEGDRRGGRAGPGDRVRRARRPRDGCRGQPARGDPAAARRRLVRLRGQVPRRRRRLRRPGRPDAEQTGAVQDGRPPRPTWRWTAAVWPASTSSSARRRRQRPAGDQRGQHDARLHADLDVPAHVGGQRGRLPRAASTGWSTGAWRRLAARGDPGAVAAGRGPPSCSAVLPSCGLGGCPRARSRRPRRRARP